MKKILLIAALSGAVVASSYAQGTINFLTFGGGVNAKATNSADQTLVAGATYLAQLYYGASGAAEAALVAVSNAPASFTSTGYILGSSGGGTRFTDPAIVAGGAQGVFQVRAWSAVLGASWEQALTAWQQGPYSPARVLGKSALITVPTGNPNAAPPDSPKPLTGLGNFLLVPVPEPSVIALAIIGLVGLVWRRRN